MPRKYQTNERPGSPSPIAICTPKRLPAEKMERAAQRACEINPLNFAPVHRLARLIPDFVPDKARLAVVTTKYWGVKGVRLTVGFMDQPDRETRRKVLQNMNAWSRFSNVSFLETNSDPQVRIARESGRDGGYWSYLGTEILEIDADEQTMNLEGFTRFTPDSEYVRVVRHETGHTLGFPHEHLRRELVQLLDREKTIRYFMRTQGWSRQEVINQVLTPIEESSLIGTERADGDSIMCYQIPGELTLSGNPIPGGSDIDKMDGHFVGTIYPKPERVERSKSFESASGEDDKAVVIDVLPDLTRVIVRRPSTGATIVTAEKDVAAAVVGCIRRISNDSEIEIRPEFSLGALGITGAIRANLGQCLNNTLRLRVPYAGQPFGPETQVQDVINDVEYRV